MTHPSRRAVPRGAVPAALLALVLTGCGGGTSSTGATDDEGTAPAVTSSPAPAPEPEPDDASEPAVSSAPDPAAGGISAPVGRDESVEIFLAAWRSGDVATLDGMAPPGTTNEAVRAYVPRATASPEDCHDDGLGSWVCAWDVEEIDGGGFLVTFTQADDETWDATGGPSGWG